MVLDDLGGAKYPSPSSARLAQLENVDAVPLFVHQLGHPLFHPSGQLIVEVGDEHALLHARAEVEQGRGQAAAAIIRYIVTDDVLHGGSSFFSSSNR